MAKKVQAMVKLQIAAGKATPAPPVGHRARSAGRQHHGLLQELQREDREGRRADHPGRRHGLRGPVLHLHHEDAAGVDAAEARREHRQGIGRAEQEQGRHGDGEAGRGDREAEDARSELPTRSRRRSRPSPARPGRWASTWSDRTNREFGRAVSEFESASKSRLTEWEGLRARLHHRRHACESAARNSRPPRRRSPPIGRTRSKKRSRSCRR